MCLCVYVCVRERERKGETETDLGRKQWKWIQFWTVSGWVVVVLPSEDVPEPVVYTGQVMLSKELLVYIWCLKLLEIFEKN